jgi:hypothetical protein
LGPGGNNKEFGKRRRGLKGTFASPQERMAYITALIVFTSSNLSDIIKVIYDFDAAIEACQKKYDLNMIDNDPLLKSIQGQRQ